jgi:hypothetical protein
MTQFNSQKHKTMIYEKNSLVGSTTGFIRDLLPRITIIDASLRWKLYSGV